MPGVARLCIEGGEVSSTNLETPSPLARACLPVFADPQVILLKLGDVVARKIGGSPVSQRWQKTADYLKTENIKAFFGIITESLEKDNTFDLQWTTDLQAAGLIEFWMHGYRLKKADEPGEFEHGTAAEHHDLALRTEEAQILRTPES